MGLHWNDTNLEVGTIAITQTLGRTRQGLIFQYAHQLPGWQKQAADAFAKAMEGVD